MSKVTLCWQDCQVIPIVTWHGRLILVNALHWINTYVRLCGTYHCAITAFKLTYMGVVCSSDKVVMNIIWERKKKKPDLLVIWPSSYSKVNFGMQVICCNSTSSVHILQFCQICLPHSYIFPQWGDGKTSTYTPLPGHDNWTWNLYLGKCSDDNNLYSYFQLLFFYFFYCMLSFIVIILIRQKRKTWRPSRSWKKMSIRLLLVVRIVAIIVCTIFMGYSLWWGTGWWIDRWAIGQCLLSLRCLGGSPALTAEGGFEVNQSGD